MARATDNPYNPAGGIHVGATGRIWSATLDNIAQHGMAFYPDAAGAVPFILLCRGGAEGSNSSLGDGRCQGNHVGTPVICTTGHSAMSVWDDSAGGGPTGYVTIIPDLREGNGGATGAAGAGDDEFGGADVMDTMQAWSIGLDLYSSRMDMSQTVIWGESRGAVNGLAAMANGITPDVCVLRSPLLDIRDWDNMDTATRATVLAPIPGFAGLSTTDEDDLNQADKNLLEARSPMRWVDKLPTTTKYLLVWGEDDTTIPEVWIDRFARKLRERGAFVQVVKVPEFGHSFDSSIGTERAYYSIRRFLAAQFS